MSEVEPPTEVATETEASQDRGCKAEDAEALRKQEILERKRVMVAKAREVKAERQRERNRIKQEHLETAKREFAIADLEAKIEKVALQEQRNKYPKMEQPPISLRPASAKDYIEFLREYETMRAEIKQKYRQKPRANLVDELIAKELAPQRPQRPQQAQGFDPIEYAYRSLGI